jgi:type I restriction enzyme S subunit
VSTVILKDLINKLESGSRPKGGALTDSGVPSLGAEHLSLSGHVDFSKKKYVTRDYFNSLKSGVLRDQDLLIVKDGATTGKVAIWMREFEDACINEHVFRIEVNSSMVLAKYAFYFLRSPKGNIQVLNDFRGATVGGISRSFINKVKLPVPFLKEQKKIVQILDTADSLRQKRKEQLTLLDIYLKSVFLDMFGDPVANDKKWDLIKIENVIFEGPQNGLYKPAQFYGKGTPILRIDCFYDGIVTDINSLKRVEITGEELEKFQIYEDNIVINRVNSRSHLGKCALIPKLKEKTIFESNMMRFSVDKTKVNPIYLTQLLLTPFVKNQILNSAKDAVNQSSINQNDVKSFDILLPKIDLQNKFADIVENVEQTKQKMRASLDEMDNHFNALMQRYFE